MHIFLPWSRSFRLDGVEMDGSIVCECHAQEAQAYIFQKTGHCFKQQLKDVCFRYRFIAQIDCLDLVLSAWSICLHLSLSVCPLVCLSFCLVSIYFSTPAPAPPTLPSFSSLAFIPSCDIPPKTPINYGV